MKITKAQRQAKKDALKSAIRKQLSSRQVTGIRVGSDPVIEVKPEYVSISRFLKGSTFNDWTGAETEKRLYVKALGQEVGTRGGFLVPAVLSNELIPLLKEKSVVRGMPGVKTIPMNGSQLKFNRVDSGPSISWGGEAVTIAEDTGLELGQDTLQTKKAVCLYKTSRELLMNANPGIDGLVREELADAIALEEDSVFLEGTGGAKPTGVYYMPTVRSTDLSGNLTVDHLKAAEYQVRLGQSSINGWAMHPRTAYDIARMKDSEGRYIFGDGLGVAGGGVQAIWNSKVAQSTQLAITNMPSSDESYLVAGDWRQFIIGEEGGLRIETSMERYFETDQVAIRLVKKVGSHIKQTGTFVVIKGITSPS